MEDNIKIVKTILAGIVEDAAYINSFGNNAHIIEEIGLDSVQIIELLLNIEEKFNIQIDYEKLDMESISSIEKIGTFIQNQMG